jgi:hypothetical protein
MGMGMAASLSMSAHHLGVRAGHVLGRIVMS